MNFKARTIFFFHFYYWDFIYFPNIPSCFNCAKVAAFGIFSILYWCTAVSQCFGVQRKKVSGPAVLLKPQDINNQNERWLSTAERRVTVWVCMGNSGDPLPGHRASSIPASAVGVVAGRPWPAFPRRSPPAGAPGPWCPFPLCAVVVAAFSLARAASAAQPSDWTSRQTETSSANTHPVQPRRHDNVSIHPSFPHPASSTSFFQTWTPTHSDSLAPPVAKKVSPILRVVRRQRDVFTSGFLPTLPSLLLIVQTGP